MRAFALAILALVFGLAPSLAAAEPKVLLITRTAGPRHANLGPPLASGLDPPLVEANQVQRGMRALAGRQGWRLEHTEDPSVIATMDGYDAVVFFSTSRDMLDDAGQAALRRHLRAGGGVVAIHNALGAMYDWRYYEGLLGGTYFRRHGPHRPGEVIVVDPADASMRGLPPRFPFKDEWYELEPAPSGVRIVATDGEGRPVAWRHCYDGGAVWVTSLGHDEALFAGAENAAAFETMITSALRSIIDRPGKCTTSSRASSDRRS